MNNIANLDFDRFPSSAQPKTVETGDPEVPSVDKASPISMEKAALLNLIRSLPDDDVRKISDYVDFILSRREKSRSISFPK